MSRPLHPALALTSLSLALLSVAPARAASLRSVDRGTWGASGVPSYVNMYIYVPDRLADRPPVVVGCHSCGTPAEGYFGSISGVVSAADRNGFILILPEATGRNCWDVGTSRSLTHDGGGDTQAVVQMVDYVISEYGADADRVYVMGGSSGAMMTQALLAVYPDVFQAGAARAGVPAGCWADGYDESNQWSGNCAGGRTNKSAAEWGDLVRGMYPGYSGPRPRLQIFHGTADATINYNNFGEAIEEWTNVLGLATAPTSTDSITTSNATYNRQFWEDDCGYVVFEAWAGQNGSHSMPYEQDAILEFFGLDVAGGLDPQVEACSSTGGSGGAGGTGGATNTGGTAPTGGIVNTGGATNTGGTSPTGGVIDTGGTPPTGGVIDTGGTPPTGGGVNTGGAPSGGVVNTGGASPTGGAFTTGGALGGAITGGTPGAGGSSGLGGVTATGGTPGTGATAASGAAPLGGALTGGTPAGPAPAAAATDEEPGCGCRVGTRSDSRPAGALLGLLALGALGGRRRGAARR